MITITCKYAVHKQREIILLQCPKTDTLNNILRRLKYVSYSSTYKAWYIAKSKIALQNVIDAVKPIATININHLRQTTQQQAQHIVKKVNAVNSSNTKNINNIISPYNQQQLVNYVQHIILKGYSKSTLNTYKSEFSIFLQTLNNVNADTLNTKRIKDYLQYCYNVLKLSDNTIHSRMNALKFYYEQLLKKEKFFWEIPRPKKPLLLPKVLNEAELEKLFKALANKKHKAMLFTAYSAGLRVSEIAALQIKHIDSTRMQILIEQSKGKKDRYVALSPVLLDILRNYIKTYTPKPIKYLFESEQTQNQYPIRSIQQVFSNAKNKAGIAKTVGIHSLRHSFATHLLDKGIDIKYIKDILGHFDIKTTERYTHVSKKQLINIVSPLDDLYKEGRIDL